MAQVEFALSCSGIVFSRKQLKEGASLWQCANTGGKSVGRVPFAEVPLTRVATPQGLLFSSWRGKGARPWSHVNESQQNDKSRLRIPRMCLFRFIKLIQIHPLVVLASGTFALPVKFASRFDLFKDHLMLLDPSSILVSN